jgi:hypothetical protein
MKQSDTLFVVLLAILASTFAIPAEALRKPTTTTPATRHARPPPPSSLLVTNVPVRGGGGGEGHRWKKTKSALSSTNNNKKTDVASGGGSFFSRFRPQATRRERVLAAWLLFWNGIALVDALMFTFRPIQNLDGYLLGSWNNAPHTLAMTRQLANCQLALIGSIALLAFTANESTLKNMFRLMILATLGAFRAIAVGVREGSVKAPWKTGYAAVMSAPPLLLLGYFAFVF